MANERITAELKRLAEQNDGLLKPEAVVEAARPARSPLHSKFCWDDTKAAQEYRLWQARQLIRVVVETIAGVEGKQEVFVSLTTDRRESGYRVMTQVLSSAEMRQQMLQDALNELQLFQRKYAKLRELASVFEAARRVRSRPAASSSQRARARA